MTNTKEILTNTKIFDITNIALSDSFKEAVKKEFGTITAKIELILNDGGIRNGKIELKLT